MALLAKRHGLAPGVDLSVAACAFFGTPSPLELVEHLVVRVVRSEMKPQVEAGGAQQSLERWESWLSSTALVRRDHRGRDAGTFGQLPLTHTRLNAGQHEERRGQRGWRRNIRSC